MESVTELEELQMTYQEALKVFEVALRLHGGCRFLKHDSAWHCYGHGGDFARCTNCEKALLQYEKFRNAWRIWYRKKQTTDEL